MSGQRARVRARSALAVAGLVALLASTAGFLVLAGLVAGRRCLGERRRCRIRQREVRRSYVEALDLLAMAVNGGHNLSGALTAVARWSRDPAASAFAQCLGDAESGRPLAEALEDLVEPLGHMATPLVSVMVASARHGAPIGPALRELASDARDDARLQAEVAARRLPVALLFPLVMCTLPAFVVLTVVPVVAESLLSLRA